MRDPVAFLLASRISRARSAAPDSRRAGRAAAARPAGRCGQIPRTAPAARDPASAAPATSAKRPRRRGGTDRRVPSPPAHFTRVTVVRECRLHSRRSAVELTDAQPRSCGPGSGGPAGGAPRPCRAATHWPCRSATSVAGGAGAKQGTSSREELYETVSGARMRPTIAQWTSTSTSCGQAGRRVPDWATSTPIRVRLRLEPKLHTLFTREATHRPEMGFRSGAIGLVLALAVKRRAGLRRRRVRRGTRRVVATGRVVLERRRRVIGHDRDRRLVDRRRPSPRRPRSSSTRRTPTSRSPSARPAPAAAREVLRRRDRHLRRLAGDQGRRGGPRLREERGKYGELQIANDGIAIATNKDWRSTA